MSLLLCTFKSESIHALDNAVLMNWDHILGLENTDNISMVDVFILIISELRS